MSLASHGVESRRIRQLHSQVKYINITDGYELFTYCTCELIDQTTPEV